MIFTILVALLKAILTVIMAPLTALASIMPTFNFNGWATAIVAAIPTPVGTVLRWLNYYVPVREAITLTVTGLAVWAAILLYRAIVDVLTKLHILGGS